MMTEYSFCQDEKVTTWRRHWFSVMADSQEQAEEIIRQNGLAKEHIDEVADGQQIIYENSEDLTETQSPMTVDENNGYETLAVLTADEKREICSNVDELEADGSPEIPATPAEQPPLLCSGCGTVINGPFYNPPCGPFCFACWEKNPQKEKDRALADALQGLAALGRSMK